MLTMRYVERLVCLTTLDHKSCWTDLVSFKGPFYWDILAKVTGLPMAKTDGRICHDTRTKTRSR